MTRYANHVFAESAHYNEYSIVATLCQWQVCYKIQREVLEWSCWYAVWLQQSRRRTGAGSRFLKLLTLATKLLYVHTHFGPVKTTSTLTQHLIKTKVATQRTTVQLEQNQVLEVCAHGWYDWCIVVCDQFTNNIVSDRIINTAIRTPSSELLEPIVLRGSSLLTLNNL